MDNIEENNIDSEFENSPEALQKEFFLNENGKRGSYFEEDDEPRKRRGRPPKTLPTEIEISMKKTAVSDSNKDALSVRSIPCFFANCTYSYKRPGSTIVEISDRPLVLPSKFEGFIIRSCKKHHDKWKSVAHLSSVCEICKGLNIAESSGVYVYNNGKGNSFFICDFCAKRQSDMLGLKMDPNAPFIAHDSIVNPEVDPSPPSNDSPVDENRSTWADTFQDYGLISSPTLSRFQRRRKLQRLDQTLNLFNFNFPPFFYDANIDFLSLGSPFWEERQSEDTQETHSKYNTRSSRRGDDHPSDEESKVVVTEDINKQQESISLRKSANGIQRKPPGKKKRNFTSTPSLASYTIYASKEVPGWILTNLTFINLNIWEGDAQKFKPEQTIPIVYVDTPTPFQMEIKNSGKDSPMLGVFSNTFLPEFTCIGEICGKVCLRRKNNRDGSTESVYSYNRDLEIDLSQFGNEFSIINEETSEKPANVRFEHIDGHVLIVSTRDIQAGEELIGDYRSSEFQDKETVYFDVFKKIDDFNAKYLTPDEKRSCAFEWFISEGYDLLKEKGKITVPIGLRVPSKKGLASNLAPKRHNHVTKDQSEWGYVAQLEMLDLERAREDCWVTFKAGKSLNFDDMDLAMSSWRGSEQASPKISQKSTLQDSQLKRENSEVSEISNGIPEISEREISMNIGDLIGSGSRATVYKGLWRGVEVSVKVPTKDMPTDKFLSQYEKANLVHPNLVSYFGINPKNQVFVVYEFLFLGSLEQWLMNNQAHVTSVHIPKIALDVAKGMEFLHSKSIVHKNLKSGNILMKSEDKSIQAKICDYLIDQESSWKFHSHDPYRAPECLTSKKFTTKSDVYSYGMVLCDMFANGQNFSVTPGHVLQKSVLLQTWDMRWKAIVKSSTSGNAVHRQNFNEIVQTIESM